MFVVQVAWLVRGLWSLVKTMLDEFTITKIKLYGSDFKEDILSIVDENCLE